MSRGESENEDDFYKYDDDNFDDDDTAESTEYYAYLEENLESLSSVRDAERSV